jgi:pyridoxamine 5'-phosphate oxidase
MSDGSSTPWSAMRAEYSRGGLHEDDLTPEPFSMFRRWLDEAAAAALPEPNAMVLSTVSEEGQPSSRMVLLKGIDEWGFAFYTNLLSRKGVELAGNPACSLLFPWHPLERQVRIDGHARLLDRDAVENYFARRPRGSQIGAHASHQSRPVADRAELQTAYDELTARFEGQEVPVPEEWGGYLVVPEAVEFWQGRPGRMHDRLVYRRSGVGWTAERLAP